LIGPVLIEATCEGGGIEDELELDDELITVLVVVLIPPEFDVAGSGARA
jgi:hypothetical protein